MDYPLDRNDAQEPEQFLWGEISKARVHYEASSDAVRNLKSQIAFSPWQREQTAAVRAALDEQRRARAILHKALQQFNEFLLEGIVPGESQGPPDPDRLIALEAVLLGLYQEWAKLPKPPDKLRHYYAERFRQMIVPGSRFYKGGVAAVRHMLTDTSRNLRNHLMLSNRMDLSIEALVLSRDWDDIFDGDDRRRAAELYRQFQM